MAALWWSAAAAILGCSCVAASAPDVIVFRHWSADVNPKAPQPTGKPPTCIRNPTVARLDSTGSTGPATLLAVAECRFWAGDGCQPKTLPTVGVGGPWPEPTRGCSRLSTDSGASWAPLVQNVTAMGAIDMQAVFLPPLNKVMLAFNRHNPRHIDDDHILWFRLGSLSRSASSAAMVWEAPVSVQQRLVRPANSAADAWWAACPGPGRATILQNPKAPHMGRIMLAVYQEGIKGNKNWDTGDCRNPNFTSPEGDWAAGYYSDDNGSSFHVSRTQDPLGPWSDYVFAGMSEPTVTQLANGSVRMDFRQGTRRKECACRMFAISNDGGTSFDSMQFDRQLISPECQGSMMEWGGSLFFSNPRSTTARTNMSVLRSDNDGENWSSQVAVSAAGVATSSSCLVELPTSGGTEAAAVGEATVGLMYERGTDDCAGASCEIVFTTLPPSRFTPMMGSVPLKSDDAADTAGISQRTPQLRFISQLSQPVIDTRSSPGTEDVAFGFEGGRVLEMDGALWLFTAELARAPVDAFMRVAIWTAQTAAGPWRRVGTIAESNQSFPLTTYWQASGNQTTSSKLTLSDYRCDPADLRASPWAPMPIFDEAENCWHVLYVGYDCDFSEPWLASVGNIFGVVSTVSGRAGIGGPYQSYGIVAGANATPPTRNLPADGWGGLNQIGPYRLPNGTYAAFLAATHNFATAASPRGPWTIGSSVAQINTPLAGSFVENPTPSQLWDPVSNKSAFIVVFDTVEHEGAGFGLASSADGVTWRNGVDVSLPKGCRTPLGLLQDADGKAGTLLFTRRFPDCSNQTRQPATGCGGANCISPAQCANVYAARFAIDWVDQTGASVPLQSDEPLQRLVLKIDDTVAVGCEAATSTLPNETIVFRAHTHGYYNYLNPALLAVSDSVVLVFAEARKGAGGDRDAIDIAVRRSSDGGRSFGAQSTIVSRGNESCLCIVPVLTRLGVLVVFECEHKCGTAPQHMSSIRSTDLGLSFSAPAEITNIPYVYGGPGPANGIVTSAGRVLVTYQVTTRCPAEWSQPSGFDGQTCVILSDDDGLNFSKGGCIPHFVGGSEGQVAQLMEDGAILLASRLYGDQKQHPPTGCRHFSTSTDEGVTFSDVFVANDTDGRCLPDPDVFVAGGGIVGSAGCEASLLSLSSHDSKRVFFASPIDGGTKKPNGIEAGRINLTLFSAEIGTAAEARTVKWKTVAQVAPSQSEYSSMCLFDNKTLAIAFVDGRGAREQGPNCGTGCCGRHNNTIRLTTYSIKTDDEPKQKWTRHHMALADRSLFKVANLSNVIGCVGVGWNTDHRHCSWNSSASAQPNNNSCITTSPAEVLAELKNENRPVGLPIVFTLSEITDPSIPGHEPFADHTLDGYYLPFLDSWVQGLTLRVTLWFAEYKRLGGTVDVLLLDFEACDYLNAGRMAGQSNSKNETEFGSAIVTLPQWPSLRAELEHMGEAHGAKFTDADMAQMKDWGRNQTDFRQYVWNAVVVSLTTARALNSSIAEPMLALFPGARISNYAHKYVTSHDPLSLDQFL